MKKSHGFLAILAIVIIAINLVLIFQPNKEMSNIQKTITGSAGETSSISITILGPPEEAGAEVVEKVNDGRGETAIGMPEKK